MKSFQFMWSMVLVLTISLTSCKKHIFNSIKGKGGTVTEIRNVTGFNKISLSINADVSYVQDSIFFVEISAQQNVLEAITTDVSAGELKIDFNKWVRKHSNIHFTIHSPDLRGLDISGSGNIEATGNITTSDLDINVSGSGNIVLSSVTSDELEAKISGSGNINISAGTVTNQKATISGSGDMTMDGLTASSSYCKISGSGSISVWVTDQLDATISGSGDIRYKGTPIVNAHMSGSGSLLHM